MAPPLRNADRGKSSNVNEIKGTSVLIANRRTAKMRAALLVQKPRIFAQSGVIVPVIVKFCSAGGEALLIVPQARSCLLGRAPYRKKHLRDRWVRGERRRQITSRDIYWETRRDPPIPCKRSLNRATRVSTARTSADSAAIDNRSRKAGSSCGSSCLPIAGARIECHCAVRYFSRVAKTSLRWVRCCE